MKILIASDHAGFTYKSALSKILNENGFDVVDLGAHVMDASDDYPDYAIKIAKALLEKKGERGILICGSAVGISIAVNKFKGVRAGVCHDTYSAHQSVEHDDINVLCMGERVIGIALATEIVKTFLAAKFSNQKRHVRRLRKIVQIEEVTMK